MSEIKNENELLNNELNNEISITDNKVIELKEKKRGRPKKDENNLLDKQFAISNITDLFIKCDKKTKKQILSDLINYL